MVQSSFLSRLWMKLLMTCCCGCNHLFLSTVQQISVDFHYSKAWKVSRHVSGLRVIKKVPPVPLNTLPVPLLLHESGLRQTAFCSHAWCILASVISNANVFADHFRILSECVLKMLLIWGHLAFGLYWKIGRLQSNHYWDFKPMKGEASVLIVVFILFSASAVSV